ncbi:MULTISPECIES: type II secretion system F family protein [unclassified Vibrio]|uniref:Type II secretion system F family protein n=1 Tax=Vibrio sp. HB236076 TaxID=3232307 RepID=A0AB39HKQ9_9VIBR|nr:type II secretion system F family protein [Vibrio sp. HB161653]MDP5253171.1 type II secretion system F family protein [Vibrio sp. HB161653]
MWLLISLLAILFALLFLIVESLRSERRRKYIEQYVRDSEKKKSSWTLGFLVKFGKENRAELEKKFVDAGIYNKSWARFYFPMKIMLLVSIVAITFFMVDDVKKALIIALFSLVAIIVLPDLVLDLRRKKLIHKVSQQLPYLLDLMSVCVQTGMTIEASFNYLAKELEDFDQDLCYQIRRTSDSARFKGIEKALDDFGHRIPTPEVRSFVLTIIQNLQYGTSVADIMSDLAEDMRKAQLLTVEEKVGKLSAKMSMPLILLIMFPIVILILAPGIMQLQL